MQEGKSSTGLQLFTFTLNSLQHREIISTSSKHTREPSGLDAQSPTVRRLEEKGNVLLLFSLLELRLAQLCSGNLFFYFSFMGSSCSVCFDECCTINMLHCQIIVVLRPTAMSHIRHIQCLLSQEAECIAQ